ncbi:pentapeptide repeat-containing protein [Streptosporangium sp. DT93]|uniref:pentapeptide repeat-containing protein n=1 Tax=Streptosporangium sp. DT93 TaxID=3393428 RepID=UPI003CF55476
MRRIGSMWRLPAVIAVVSPVVIWWAILGPPLPEWSSWVITGVVVAAGTGLSMAVLLGPVARRMAGEHEPLTAQDREQLSVKDRIDAVGNARTTLLQAATGLVVVGGLIFTGAGLVYTARTLDVSARTLDATRDGQIADRYTRAVEQLGSPKIDVRLGGIYALQRLGVDSARDRPTVLEVLTAYVSVHARPPASEVVRKQASEVVGEQAAVDVFAALTVIVQLDPDPARDRVFDLRAVDLHGLDLTRVNVLGSDLSDANLRRATLHEKIVRGVTLDGADLTGVRLSRADLPGAAAGAGGRVLSPGPRLSRATLTGAEMKNVILVEANLGKAILTNTVLTGSYLSRASLKDAKLRGAKLIGADLTDADLTGADLTGADLRDAVLKGTKLGGAILEGADLRKIRGKSQEAITLEARTDAETQFS